MSLLRALVADGQGKSILSTEEEGRAMSWSKLVAPGLAGLLVVGCAEAQQTEAPGRADSILEARAQLISALDRCKEVHDFDPAAMTAVQENALAANELAWRQCAYEALRDYRNPDPMVRQQIESLITQDMAMTGAIQQGTMTRSQRRARNLEKIEEIKSLEEAQAEAAAVAQAQHQDQVRQLVTGMRGFAR